jgi:hypothetical protein
MTRNTLHTFEKAGIYPLDATKPLIIVHESKIRYCLTYRGSRIATAIEPPTEYNKLVILAHQIDELVAGRDWTGVNAIAELLGSLDIPGDQRRGRRLGRKGRDDELPYLDSLRS